MVWRGGGGAAVGGGGAGDGGARYSGRRCLWVRAGRGGVALFGVWEVWECRCAGSVAGGVWPVVGRRGGRGLGRVGEADWGRWRVGGCGVGGGSGARGWEGARGGVGLVVVAGGRGGVVVGPGGRVWGECEGCWRGVAGWRLVGIRAGGGAAGGGGGYWRWRGCVGGVGRWAWVFGGVAGADGGRVGPGWGRSAGSRAG